MQEERIVISGRDTTKRLFHRKTKTGLSADARGLELRQRQEINRKAKVAGACAGIGRLLAIAAFIVMLCQLMLVFWIIAGLAVLCFLVAVLFGILALREIGDSGQPGTNRARQAIGIALGTIGLIASLTVAGLVQGTDLADASVSFATIAADTRIWLQLAIASQALLLAGNLLLAFHFVRLLKTQSSAPAAQLFRQPPTMEASVS